jgi:triosephosphate isomerase
VEHASEVMKMIAEVVGQKCPILYGGSVAAGNAREFWEIEVLSGFLVGNTSLDPNEWKALVEVTRS